MDAEEIDDMKVELNEIIKEVILVTGLMQVRLESPTKYTIPLRKVVVRLQNLYVKL